MNSSGSEPVVELRNVTKRYQSVVAVNDVSLKIEKGEFFSLLGPSGCGKTTTLRMIGGFVHPDEGDIYIGEKPVNGIPPYRRDTNMVFQQLALFPHLNVFDNIAFGPIEKRKLNRAEIIERVLKILDMVDLRGYENRHIRQLSGGQQQRVAIARALINEPKVLLLDEPLGALDLKLRLQMQMELKDLQQRLGMTFIYVTHDQGEALTMSDRIAVMNRGRVEQVAPSEIIYSQPASEFVAKFIGDTNLLQGQVRSNDGNDILIDCNGIQIRTTNTNAALGEEVSLSIRPEKIKIGSPLSNMMSDNAFDATIQAITFLGSILRYDVILDSELKLLIQTSNESENIWEKGDRVRVSWLKENCILIHKNTV